MRRVLCLLAFAALFAPGPLQAGPWAREPGEIFFSFSSNSQATVDSVMLGQPEFATYNSLYAEIGLGRRLTFGLEYGWDDYVQEVMGFLRYTLTPPDQRFQFAVDLGAGRREIEVLGERDLLRAGVSLGYGFSAELPDWVPLDFSGGWVSMDAIGVWDTTESESRWKVEATLGVNATDRLSVMLQLVAEEWPGNDVTYGINPSVVFDIFDATSVEIGARATISDNPQMGFELGLWHRF